MKREGARGSPVVTAADSIEIGGRIQVAVQSTLIWDNADLRESLSSSDGFDSYRLSGDVDSVLSDCEKLGHSHSTRILTAVRLKP